MTRSIILLKAQNRSLTFHFRLPRPTLQNISNSILILFMPNRPHCNLHVVINPAFPLSHVHTCEYKETRFNNTFRNYFHIQWIHRLLTL